VTKTENLPRRCRAATKITEPRWLLQKSCIFASSSKKIYRYRAAAAMVFKNIYRYRTATAVAARQWWRQRSHRHGHLWHNYLYYIV
jgi:hypothetical protein